PLAGGWLTTVKVTMGFVELAAAVKFVSNIDLVYQWGLLTRPAFLAVWFTLALVTACYLAGWLRLPNEYGGERIGWLRQGFAVACFAAAMACLGGVRGNSLGTMDAFLPPRSYGQKEGTAVAGELQWELNYEKAVARARAEGKPLFLNFTGVTCTNCRLMEENMFPRKAVKEELAHFVLAELFTDKETEESARYQKLEQELYKTVALPYYAVRTADGQRILEFPGQTWNEQEFLQFLRKAREGFAQIRTGTGEAQVATAVAP
ncbi:MAG: DUF255 domain-containing protein, partial [Armatimonadetes bacterium]|nr:DUF255 domain-containing protein [Armatimonadota bacterium]